MQLMMSTENLLGEAKDGAAQPPLAQKIYKG